MKVTKKMGFVTVLALALGAVGVAAAEEAGAPVDREAHRAAMKAKFEERRAEMLTRFDVNKDGKLDDAERKTMRDTLTSERFKTLDSNGDGVLSLAEFQAGAGKLGHRFHKHHGGGDQGGGTPGQQ